MLQRQSNFSCEEKEKMEIQNFLMITWEARNKNAGTEFMFFEPLAMPFGTLKTTNPNTLFFYDDQNWTRITVLP